MATFDKWRIYDNAVEYYARYGQLPRRLHVAALSLIVRDWEKFEARVSVAMEY